jgi:hypothetical protein
MGGGSSTPTCDCCASFIDFCEGTFDTNNCTLCGVDIAATGIEFLDDYLEGSTISFLKEKTLEQVPLNYPYKITKGVLDTSTPSGLAINRLLQDKHLFTVVSGGTLYISGLSRTLVSFRKNLQSFSKSVNIFTSMASSYIIKTANQDISIINDMFEQKLGFPISKYNYYMKNPYYDYNGDQLNTYALEIVRINSIIVFIWHIIYAQAIQNNINIDYPFYIQFYLSMFENLNGTNVILPSQINPYFIKYSPNIIPDTYTPIIIKWTEIISKARNLTDILIYKMTSRLLNENQLLYDELTENNLKLSRSTVKQRLKDCIDYRNSINSSYDLPTLG